MQTKDCDSTNSIECLINENANWKGTLAVGMDVNGNAMYVGFLLASACAMTKRNCRKMELRHCHSMRIGCASFGWKMKKKSIEKAFELTESTLIPSLHILTHSHTHAACTDWLSVCSCLQTVCDCFLCYHATQFPLKTNNSWGVWQQHTQKKESHTAPSSHKWSKMRWWVAPE